MTAMPTLLVHVHYKFSNSFSAGMDFKRQILTFEAGPALKEAKSKLVLHIFNI